MASAWELALSVGVLHSCSHSAASFCSCAMGGISRSAACLAASREAPSRCLRANWAAAGCSRRFSVGDCHQKLMAIVLGVLSIWCHQPSGMYRASPLCRGQHQGFRLSLYQPMTWVVLLVLAACLLCFCSPP